MRKTKNKRGGIILWIIIILVIMVAGVGIYFWLTGDSSPIAGMGNSIPHPPALPS